VRRTRRVDPFGDSALTTATTTQHEANALAALIRTSGWDGVEDVVVGHESVTVTADPMVTDLAGLEEEMSATSVETRPRRRRRLIEIAVSFDGPDIAEVAKIARVAEHDVVEMLVTAQLEVAFLGFAPGFAYLSGLPKPLRDLQRRNSPRPRVPAGSLAVAGGFAAIYPQSSPGGWHLVGRTGLRMFDPDSTLQPDDTVRLVATPAPAVDDAVTDQMLQTPLRPRPPLRTSASRRVNVEGAGMLSLVQDQGRLGKAWLGVPRAGSADPVSMRLANRLAGNHDAAAVIEVTGGGPALRVFSDSSVHVAVVGDAEVRIDGLPAAPNAVEPVSSGQLLSVGATGRGLRAYVAFGGGLETPVVMGSRSSDLLCRLGPGALVAGDVLALGPPTRPRGRLHRPPTSLEHGEIRVVAGPDELSSAQKVLFETSTFAVDEHSDRVGVRLRGPELRRPELLGEETCAPSHGVRSRGMVNGAVQLPPDGNPIVLLCDHATVGGYPVIATVVRADLGRLGQLRPGDDVRFEVVGRRDALKGLKEIERELDTQVTSWYPVRTD
jgi:KipI family sensor histidine kinase inhibitor